jgi:hypothetical protein
MDQEQKSKSPKLGWTFEELASSLSVSVPFLRLEVKRVVSVNWWKSNWHKPSTSEQLTMQLLTPPPFVN